MSRRAVKTQAAPVALDLSFLEARPVVTRTWRSLSITLVGCGGTGSWLAPAIARIARVLLDAGEPDRRVSVTFVDPDTVEQKNLARQNFCAAELGANKARALALRYGAAWGLDIKAVPRQYLGDGTGTIL